MSCKEVTDCGWDRELAASHLHEANKALMQSFANSLHHVAKVGFLEAAGLRNDELQRFCTCLYRQVEETVARSVAKAVKENC